jgi:hypothetical protein
MRLDVAPSGLDPLSDALQPGDYIGVLGIMLHNRRRNRANGRVVSKTYADGGGGGAGGGGDSSSSIEGTAAQPAAASLVMEVDDAFGNCPQYIVRREVSALVLPPLAPPTTLSQAPAAEVPTADAVSTTASTTTTTTAGLESAIPATAGPLPPSLMQLVRRVPSHRTPSHHSPPPSRYTRHTHAFTHAFTHVHTPHAHTHKRTP